jgi:glycosyltransferase involved in cell wall biosynthesis
MLFLRTKPRIKHPKIVMTLLVRDEADVIDLFVQYHSRTGIDALIVTDNGSTDGTRELLEQHRRDGTIAEIIDEPSRIFDQSGFVHRMILRARDHYSADYCINSDADEFWFCAEGSFRDELSRSRASKIYCTSYFMLPANGEPFWKSTDCCVKKAQDPDKFEIARYFNLFEEPARMAKVIHRTRGYKMIGLGNHCLKMRDKVSEISKTIWIYHYSVRSVQQFQKKIIQGGAAIELNKNSTENECTHWRYLYRGHIGNRLNLQQEFYKITAASCIEELRKASIVVSDPTMRTILATLAPNARYR